MKMTQSEKIDLFKQFKSEYKAVSKPLLIQTTPANYLMIEGQDAPGGAVFEEAVGALYSMAFTIKMTRKFAGQGDYVVCKLEGLWYGPDGSDNLCDIPQDKWCWQLLIRTPDCVTQVDLDAAVGALLDKGKCDKVKDVRLQIMDQGRCVQILHVGPYDQVGAAIEKMQTFADEQGLSLTGKHHEIYLSDPRRVPPEKLKTIVRRPVK
jgi:hypothetical protein